MVRLIGKFKSKEGWAGDMSLLEGRDFQLWDYHPSFQRLLIRSPRRNTDDYNVDIIFWGVEYLNLPSFLYKIKITLEFEENDHRITYHFHMESGGATVRASHMLIDSSYTSYFDSPIKDPPV